ncbi:hypothetical protein CDAR_35211 [Caerostris darwini]|uniref:Uncharacterized protein n=1 Tax=Caerostris darwini TaxID=1538125 RepID=A0AAV4SJT1_9ARAC|nr:hypothetical protein CDAR_35211 [Caerostris darwini]
MKSLVKEPCSKIIHPFRNKRNVPQYPRIPLTSSFPLKRPPVLPTSSFPGVFGDSQQTILGVFLLCFLLIRSSSSRCRFEMHALISLRSTEVTGWTLE